MQLVVVMAVRNAVSAATTTFTAISTIRFFITSDVFFNHELREFHSLDLGRLLPKGRKNLYCAQQIIRLLTSLNSLTLGIARIHSALHSLIREIRAIRGFNLSV